MNDIPYKGPRKFVAKRSSFAKLLDRFNKHVLVKDFELLSSNSHHTKAPKEDKHDKSQMRR